MKKLIIIAFCLALYASGAMAASFADGAMAYNSKNYALAYKEIAPLAQGGNADAEHLLGLMYYTGNAVIQDHKEAVIWFRKAAEQGHAEAQQVLGLMYRYHIGGMPQDNVIAYMLWNLAAAGGSSNAAEQRALVVKVMTQEQIEEGQALSAA